MNSRYCKIFVDGPVSRENLAQGLVSELGVKVLDEKTLSTPVGEVEIRDNDDSDRERNQSAEDGFLFFDFYIELEAPQSVTHRVYVDFVVRLLNALWGLGYRAVAACDFEDELPTAARS